MSALLEWARRDLLVVALVGLVGGGMVIGASDCVADCAASAGRP